MRFHLYGLWIGFSLLFGICAADGQEPARPRTTAEWSERLRKLPDPLGRDDYLFLNQFQALDARTVFQMIRDNWTQIKSEHGRTHMVQYSAFEPQNPYLLAILHLGRTDKSPRVRKMALQCLRHLTFQDFSDTKTYMEWLETQGKRPLREIVQASCRRYVAQIQQEAPAQKLRLLDYLLEVPFVAEGVVEGSRSLLPSEGLILLRREALHSAGVVSALCKLLEPTTPRSLRLKAVSCLAHFQPSADSLLPYTPVLHRAMPLLLNSSEATVLEKLELLAELRTEWAISPLLALAQSEFGETNLAILVRALLKVQSLRVVPLLITMLEAVEMDLESVEEQNILTAALQQLCPDSAPQGNKAEWRAWWLDQRVQYNPTIAKQTFPRLMTCKRASQTIYRRIFCPLYRGERAEREGWYVASGTTLANRPTTRLPGLIVLLFSEKETYLPSLGRAWWEVLQKGFRGEYLLALLPASKMQDSHSLKEILASLPIDKRRIWLLAEGDLTGTTLESPTETLALFQGFWLVNPTLPPSGLAETKLRTMARTLLQVPPQITGRDFLRVRSVEDSLKRAGRVVRILNEAYALKNTEGLERGVRWLENGTE